MASSMRLTSKWEDGKRFFYLDGTELATITYKEDRDILTLRETQTDWAPEKPYAKEAFMQILEILWPEQKNT